MLATEFAGTGPDIDARRPLMTDHALTRPWSALKSYRCSPDKHPIWREENCRSITRLIKIGSETYFKGADDNLLPTRKDQPPPDLRYFKRSTR